MSRPTLLAAAFSARQIAESAALAGFDTLAVDFFADRDTRAAAKRSEVLHGDYPDGFADAGLIAALDRVSEGEAPIGFIYGAGFEDRPALLDAIGARWPILGTGPDTVRRLTSPEAFAELCAAAGIAHPAIRRDAPPTDEAAGWLAKAEGGCGGSHIREAAGLAAMPQRYFQAFVAGESWSAGFIAAGGRATVLGFTRQWADRGGDPGRNEPFRYGGAVGPLDPPGKTGKAMEEAVSTLVERAAATDCPILGMASADFRITPDGGAVLLEVNARAGATIDLFDAAASGRDSLVGRHLAAVLHGDVGVRPAPAGRVRASGLAWAERAGHIPSDLAWPPGVRDRSRDPVAVAAGQPIATVIADGADETEAMERFAARSAELKTMIERIEAA